MNMIVKQLLKDVNFSEYYAYLYKSFYLECVICISTLSTASIQHLYKPRNFQRNVCMESAILFHCCLFACFKIIMTIMNY